MSKLAVIAMPALILLFGVQTEGRGQQPPAEPGSAANSQPEEARLIDSVSGPALYTAYCSVCHGWDGHGQGPMAKALKVKPSNLTRLAVRNGGAFSVDRIEHVISGETVLSRGHGTREMPIWGPIFSQVGRDRDFGPVRIHNLAKYIEEMQNK
jgi:mono/diheme cytochrome c family protein